MTPWEQELGELKARVERLETTVRQLANEERQMTPLTPNQLSDQEQVLAWLRAEGFVRNPTPEERRLAAEWEALPEEEKQTHIRSMHKLALDPPLSQTILANRH
ncbi:MAG: hypothetical protein HY268_04550 [Deltaproteobacteria bacterium]|nr:hypothetical protein [Deltaproteobacteria bacterium]